MEKNKTKKFTVWNFVLNAFAWLSFFLAVLLFLLVLFSAFSGSPNDKSLLGYKMLIVESDSMSLSQESEQSDIYFSSGDVIFVKKVEDYSAIRVGDVISFVSYNPESEGKTVTHKVRTVIKTASGALVGYETYGIHTGVSDQVIVEPSAVLGKYIGKAQGLGHLFSFFKKPAGFFTVLLIPCLLLLIHFSIKVGKYLARKEMSDTLDSEIGTLKGRISQLESNKGEVVVMQSPVEELAVTADTVQQPTQPIQPAQPMPQPQQTVISQPAPTVIQVPVFNEKQLELTTKALTSTIETLTRTIENLVMAVEKPVQTLASTVQTLAVAKTQPTPAPVVEQPVQVEIQPVVVEQAPVQEPTPVVEEQTAQTQTAESETAENQSAQAETNAFGAFRKQSKKVPFQKRLLALDKEIKGFFSEVHNELISYKKVHYRVSFKGISYRVGRNAIAKMVVRGKTLTLYLALNVDDYATTVYFQKDSSAVKSYEEVPFTVKIKSNRGKNNALKLVGEIAQNKSLIKIDDFKKEDIIKLIRALNK